MKIEIDTEKRIVTVQEQDGGAKELPFDSREGFKAVSDAWVQVGWDVKHVYTFSWLGRPIIQLPEDMIRLQELIFSVKPTVIVETGVAHGGSLVFSASLMRMIHPDRKCKVIGVDVEIRKHNRDAIEEHLLSEDIVLIEGDSVSAEIVSEVETHCSSDDTVMVVLDSNHSKGHVLEEIRCYGSLVTKGSYLVATDGIMKDLKGAPRSEEDWPENNPAAAVHTFLEECDTFELREPEWSFNESTCLTEEQRISYWPDCYLRKL